MECDRRRHRNANKKKPDRKTDRVTNATKIPGGYLIVNQLWIRSTCFAWNWDIQIQSPAPPRLGTHTPSTWFISLRVCVCVYLSVSIIPFSCQLASQPDPRSHVCTSTVVGSMHEQSLRCERLLCDPHMPMRNYRRSLSSADTPTRRHDARWRTHTFVVCARYAGHVFRIYYGMHTKRIRERIQNSLYSVWNG